MKKLLFSVLIFSSFNAFAAGGFDCLSADGKITVTGNYSSAGSSVVLAKVNGKDLVVGDEYGKVYLTPEEYAASTPATNPEIYNGLLFFGFKIMDTNVNATYLQAELAKYEDPADGEIKANGYVWIDNDQATAQEINCSWTY